MGQNPEAVRAEIELARQKIAADVDAIDDRINPKKVVDRRVNATKETLSGLRDKVMGVGASMKDTTGGAAASAKGSISSAASNAGDTISSAPGTIRTQTEGSPFLAGAAAIGLGYLLGSLIPTSKVEEQQAGALKGKLSENLEPVKQEFRQVAQDVKEQLQPQLDQSIGEVKDTATAGVDEVKATASQGADDVKATTTDGTDAVRSQVSDSTDQLRSDDSDTFDDISAPRTAPENQQQYSSTSY